MSTKDKTDYWALGAILAFSGALSAINFVLSGGFFDASADPQTNIMTRIGLFLLGVLWAVAGACLLGIGAGALVLLGIECMDALKKERGKR